MPGTYSQDVRAWLIAVLAAERITWIVIRGGRGDIALAVSPQASHGRLARMSESHAGTSLGDFFRCFRATQKVEAKGAR